MCVSVTVRAETVYCSFVERRDSCARLVRAAWWSGVSGAVPVSLSELRGSERMCGVCVTKRCDRSSVPVPRLASRESHGRARTLSLTSITTQNSRHTRGSPRKWHRHALRRTYQNGRQNEKDARSRGTRHNARESKPPGLAIAVEERAYACRSTTQARCDCCEEISCRLPSFQPPT